MKELISTIFKTAEDRIKNPFIGAFSISWILINWKSILLLLFSNKTIEDRIQIVEEKYTAIEYFLYFPLASAVAFTLFRPIIELIISFTLRRIDSAASDLLTGKRIKVISDENIIELKKIELEENKAEFIRRNSENNLVEGLRNEIGSLTQELETTRSSANTTINSLRQEIATMNKHYSERIEELTNPSHFFLKDTIFKKKDDEVFLQARKNSENLNLKSASVTIFKSGLKILQGRDRLGVEINFDLDNKVKISDEELVNMVGEEYFVSYTLDGELISRPIISGNNQN